MFSIYVELQYGMTFFMAYDSRKTSKNRELVRVIENLYSIRLPIFQ